jgi:hypothetical protein
VGWVDLMNLTVAGLAEIEFMARQTLVSLMTDSIIACRALDRFGLILRT